MNRNGTRRERPSLQPGFYKAHGLGNDYLVFEAGEVWTATREAVKEVCHRNRGVGSDGIVCRMGDADGSQRLRMFNPDGSEFERSGNGLRVFAAYLASREEVVEADPFRVEVGGDVVEMEVLGSGPEGYDVRIDMGRAEVGAGAVGADGQYLTEEGGIEHPRLGLLEVTPVSVGNPHCVYFTSRPGVEILREAGPFLSSHRAFPRGVNVQVVRDAGPGRLDVHVWERGAGETSASGTSACAAAVAAVHRGLQDPGPITVDMPGGGLQVDVADDFRVRLRGPVREVCAGRLAGSFCRDLSGR